MCNDGPHYYEYTINYDDSSFYIISFLDLDHLTLSLTLKYTDLCEDEDFCIHTNQHIDHGGTRTNNLQIRGLLPYRNLPPYPLGHMVLHISQKINGEEFVRIIIKNDKVGNYVEIKLITIMEYTINYNDSSLMEYTIHYDYSSFYIISSKL